MGTKQAKLTNRFLKFLPKVASFIALIQKQPFSPGKDKRSSGNKRKHRPQLSRNGFAKEEPTSPKVSCVGQIKHKNKICQANDAKYSTKNASVIKKCFGGAKPAGRMPQSVCKNDKAVLSDRAPTLSQMKRFESGRDSLANFDWKAQVAPVGYDDRDYYSYEERRSIDDEEKQTEVIIPFSAPLMVGGEIAVRPRKEINLWKRRTICPPPPIRVN